VKLELCEPQLSYRQRDPHLVPVVSFSWLGQRHSASEVVLVSRKTGDLLWRFDARFMRLAEKASESYRIQPGTKRGPQELWMLMDINGRYNELVYGCLWIIEHYRTIVFLDLRRFSKLP
jgi:hypothetical protein